MHWPRLNRSPAVKINELDKDISFQIFESKPGILLRLRELKGTKYLNRRCSLIEPPVWLRQLLLFFQRALESNESSMRAQC
jgi:hypothetical protein